MPQKSPYHNCKHFPHPVGDGASTPRNTGTNPIVGDDAHIVPKPYGRIAEKYIRNVPEIEKYVIMPDHIHMIIRLDNGSMCSIDPYRLQTTA